eukprot:scaffold4097_cov166-Amphora_coffeaeformis.AAC.56
MKSILSSLSSLVHSLVSSTSNLENVGQVLETRAVPGLMTILDVALQRSVEIELTGTLTTSHAVLAALLDVKRQAKRVIELVRTEGVLERQIQSTTNQSNKVVVESFARACLDAACDILQVLSTEKLAETANLSDPYENMNTSQNGSGNSASISASMNSAHSDAPELPTVSESSAIDPTATESVGLTPLSTHSPSSDSLQKGSNSRSSESTDDWWKALKDSNKDTGRWIPLAQRPRDLWETARLHCVDFIWAEEVTQSSQRILRHLVKHPLVSEVNHYHAQQSTARQLFSREPPTLTSFSAKGQEEIMVLLQLIQVDVPARLLQFRAASEHESVVLKRLYILKCECRAPFRAFLEAHQSVLRAPPVETFQAFETGSSRREDLKRRAKEKLQKLLETPALVDCLTLEQTSQHLEIEISKALYPFCELARYFDHKRASIRHSNAQVMLDFQILLHRLKGLLTRKSSGHDWSAGIRPLLMDLQKMPRQDEIDRHTASIVSTSDEWQVQVENLLQQLELLNELCRTRGSFWSDKKADVEAPAVLVEQCAQLDVELLRCHFLDWYSVVEQQHQTDQDWGALAEKIRQAEMEVSLAGVATSESLQLLAQRLRALEQDREKRFRVLVECLEDFGKLELNLLIKLDPPDTHEVLALRPTSAKGVFGLPLEMAGETLPVG